VIGGQGDGATEEALASAHGRWWGLLSRALATENGGYI
jgi:hypothetical protein